MVNKGPVEGEKWTFYNEVFEFIGIARDASAEKHFIWKGENGEMFVLPKDDFYNSLFKVEKVNEELELIPDYGDHMTIGEFACYVADASLLDCEGFGVWATDTHVSDKRVCPSNLSDGAWLSGIPEYATHVVWFNK